MGGFDNVCLTKPWRVTMDKIRVPLQFLFLTLIAFAAFSVFVSDLEAARSYVTSGAVIGAIMSK